MQATHSLNRVGLQPIFVTGALAASIFTGGVGGYLLKGAPVIERPVASSPVILQAQPASNPHFAARMLQLELHDQATQAGSARIAATKGQASSSVSAKSDTVQSGGAQPIRGPQ